eukprot:GFYU01005112.1.p1 GENE.GFYU01005112.1~~GFYU01005112.1.p1  ORF type:complete len:584 (-),score=219.80 GFYU01005112.1:42-1562(-)
MSGASSARSSEDTGLKSARKSATVEGQSTVEEATTTSVEQARKKKQNEMLIKFCRVAAAGNLEEMKRLLTTETDVSVNGCDYDGRTPLHVAASEGNVDIVKLLLAQEAEHSPIDAYGGTPLVDAVRHKHDDVIEVLKEAGAKLEFEDAAVRLCDLAATGNAPDMKRNCENGLDPTEGDYDMRTPLHLAASNGHIEVVKQLVETYAVPINPIDRWKGTPLQDAIRHRHMDIAQYLRSRGGEMGETDTSVELCEAASICDMDALQNLVNNGVDLNAGDYDGRTAIHLAASNGHVVAVNYLLALGCDINPIDRYGGTPLADAVRHNHPVVRILLEKFGAKGEDDPTIQKLFKEKRQQEVQDLMAAKRKALESKAKEAKGEDNEDNDEYEAEYQKAVEADKERRNTSMEKMKHLQETVKEEVYVLMAMLDEVLVSSTESNVPDQQVTEIKSKVERKLQKLKDERTRFKSEMRQLDVQARRRNEDRQARLGGTDGGSTKRSGRSAMSTRRV